jgi:hypothetical protein
MSDDIFKIKHSINWYKIKDTTHFNDLDYIGSKDSDFPDTLVDGGGNNRGHISYQAAKQILNDMYKFTDKMMLSPSSNYGLILHLASESHHIVDPNP